MTELSLTENKVSERDAVFNIQFSMVTLLMAEQFSKVARDYYVTEYERTKEFKELVKKLEKQYGRTAKKMAKTILEKKTQRIITGDGVSHLAEIKRAFEIIDRHATQLSLEMIGAEGDMFDLEKAGKSSSEVFGMLMDDYNFYCRAMVLLYDLRHKMDDDQIEDILGYGSCEDKEIVDRFRPII